MATSLFGGPLSTRLECATEHYKRVQLSNAINPPPPPSKQRGDKRHSAPVKSIARGGKSASIPGGGSKEGGRPSKPAALTLPASADKRRKATTQSDIDMFDDLNRPSPPRQKVSRIRELRK